MAFPIEHVLSPTNTEISPVDGIESREFSIVSKSVVRLEGIINDNWDVESKRKDGTEWISETLATFGIGERPSREIKQVTIEGNPNLVYRIVLGTGNSGPNGYVYPIGVQAYD